MAFVATPESPFRGQVDRYLDDFGGSIDLIGAMENEIVGVFDRHEQAEQLLRDDEVDIVVAFPDDPVAEVAAGERASVTVTHTRLDPIERTAIWFISQVAVDEINGTLLGGVLDTARDRSLGNDDETVESVVAAAPDALDPDLVRAVLGADTEVLVRPLDREVRLAVDDVDDVTDWYAPAAIVLMLQQLGVALGALAFVRERKLGIDEVFRIAPVGGASSVIGKYLAYVGIGAAIAAALTALAATVLGVPLAGGTGEIATVMILTLVASTGVGFVISLVSRTEAQAVQYSMLVLLASLFFSGFFLSLDQMQGPSRWIAWALPVTYGMRLLRDTMLRDAGLEPGVVLALAGYGVALAAVAVTAARRRMRHAA
jgi:ABC-2 type transport system permease protein